MAEIVNAGGACGYQTAVGKQPFDSMIAAGSTPLYMDGEGCGACYEVRLSAACCGVAGCLCLPGSR
jgi:hypothetical protein